MAPTPSSTPQPPLGDPSTWLTPTLLVGTLSVAVSCLALVTTVLFFRRLNTRRGKLSSARPHSFGLHPTGGSVSIVLPLVIYNDGAVPIIVQDIRLRIDKSLPLFKRQRREDEKYLEEHRDQFPDGAILEEESRPAEMRLGWKGTKEGMEATAKSVLPAVFAVPGRTAETRFVEFEQLGYYADPRRGEHVATVEVQLSHKKSWITLCAFDFHLPLATLQRKYTIYRNRDEFEFDE